MTRTLGAANPRDGGGSVGLERGEIECDAASRDQSLLLILIPTYNDWSALDLLLVGLDVALSDSGLSAQVLIVDDGSSIGPGNEVSDVYKNTVMKNHHGGVILVGEHLYGYSDGSGWICQNFETGDVARGSFTATGMVSLLYLLAAGTSAALGR